MGYYSTLGVSRNATADEIKKAYRALAVELHPDKQGGSHEAFAPVAQAYGVLSDPEKRKQYDETGTNPQLTVELQVQSALMNLFSQAIAEDVPIINSTRNGLVMLESRQENLISQCEQHIQKLTKKRELVTIKGDKLNMVHCVIDQQLETVSRNIEEAKVRIQICKMALELLDDYEETEEEAEEEAEEGRVILNPRGARLFYSTSWRPTEENLKKIVDQMMEEVAEHER